MVGPDVGKRALGTSQGRDSPTLAAAAYAVGEAKLPAIASYGASGPPSDYMDHETYGNNLLNYELALQIIEAVTNNKNDLGPFLSDNTSLNVNFRRYDVRNCYKKQQVKLILTRVNFSKGFDAYQCGSFHLPTNRHARIGVAVFEEYGESLEEFCDIVECSPCEVAGFPVQQRAVSDGDGENMPELWRVGQINVDAQRVDGRRQRGKVQPC